MPEVREDLEADEKEILNSLLSNRTDKEKTIRVVISGLSFTVLRNIPRHIEEEIHKYRQKVADLGEDYLPDTLDEAKRPLFLILSGLCAEKPYNKPAFWQEYDIQSDGDTSTMLDDILAGIEKWKEKHRKFR